MEELLPVLATALAGLRRAPGNNLAWVDDVLRKLQRQQPDEYQQLRRVHGLALRIAEMDALEAPDRATLTLAMFLATVAGTPLADGTDRRPWLDYLRQPWLEPALQAAASIADRGSEPHGLVPVIATTASRLDEAAIFRTTSTLAVLRGLRTQARTRETEGLAEVLWSEEGQALCDLHARMRGQPYRFEPADIKAAIDTLKAQPPAALAAETQAPRQTREDRGSTTEAAAPAGKADSPNFEKRKQVLAVHGDLRHAFATGVVGGASPPPPVATLSIDQGPPEALAPAADVPPAEEDQSTTPSPPQSEEPPWDEPREQADEPAPAANTSGKDIEMTNNRETTAGRSPRPDLTTTVNELRGRLLEIERASADAQQLLASLQPSIEELTAMLAQVETMLGRWHTTTARAA